MASTFYNIIKTIEYITLVAEHLLITKSNFLHNDKIQ